MPDLCEHFANSIEAALNDCHTGKGDERWNHICDVIYKSAMDTFSKRERQNPDWFEEGITEPQPVITAKGAALVEYKRDPSEKSLVALRKARNNVQGIAWCCANEYWLNLWQGIQLFADCSNICAMHDGMTKAFGLCATRIAPLKSTTGDIINDWGKQMERWVEHYQELYSRESTVTDSAVRSTCTLNILEELDIPPAVEEQSKANNHLACGKAPEKMASHQKSSKLASRLPSSATPMSFCYSAGERVLCSKICTMPTSSPYTGTRVTTATAAITMEPPSSALLGRPLPVWYWTGCRCLLSMFTQKHRVDSGLEDQQSTWSSHYISSKRSATNIGNLCTLHFLTWPRLLTWSVEKASLLYCRGLDILLNSWGWLHLFIKACILSSMMALLWTLPQLGTEWNRGVHLPQHSLASSSPCCCNVPSVSQKMAYTSPPEVIEASSASHASKWRPGCKEYWLGGCCLQMMLPWLHTLRKLYSNSSAASHVHVENLVLLLVLRRLKSWAKTSVASVASPLVTTPLRLWRISPTLVPSSPTTSPLMLNWPHWLARQ